jgi:hypothetical protein
MFFAIVFQGNSLPCRWQKAEDFIAFATRKRV